MNRLFLALVFSVIAAAAVHAQQQPTTALDRLSVAFGQCVGNAERHVDEIAELKKQLEAAQARIREIEPNNK